MYMIFDDVCWFGLQFHNEKNKKKHYEKHNQQIHPQSARTFLVPHGLP